MQCRYAAGASIAAVRTTRWLRLSKVSCGAHCDTVSGEQERLLVVRSVRGRDIGQRRTMFDDRGTLTLWLSRG